MNPKELETLLAKGETERLAFLCVPDLPGIIQTVCAFLNQKGGQVLVGVDTGGPTPAMPVDDNYLNHLKQKLTEEISPAALWTLEEESVQGKTFLALNVPEGQNKPYVTGGAIYLRRKARTQPATRDELTSLIRHQTGSPTRWERELVSGATLDDLDIDLLKETIERAISAQRWQSNAGDVEEFLYRLGLSSEGNLTQAAILLYGKQPTRILPQARVRFLVLPEGKTGSRYEVDQTFETCLLRMAREIPAALTPYTLVESQFPSDSWQREDHVRYPMTALREGIMNALVHRDYRHPGNITLTISLGSLVIANPGSLPEGLKPSDLKRDHLSCPQNPDIAHICFLHGLIEKVGRGTQRILEDCRRAGLREPKWQSKGFETTLTFPSRSASEAYLPLTELNERQVRMIEALRENPILKPADVVALFAGKVTDRTLRTDLEALVDGGWMGRQGKGRSVSYVPGPEMEK